MGEVEPSAEGAREDGRVNAVELEDLFGGGLVLAIEQAVGSAAREVLVQQLEICSDAVIGGVVAGKRLREIEN